MLSVFHQLSVEHSGHLPVKVLLAIYIMQYCYNSVLITAPSTSPVMVNVSLIHFSLINVSWGAVPCQHRNGEITGYIVMYRKYRSREGEGGGGQGNRQTQEERIMVDGHTATIDDLDPLTEYSVMVAGVNSAGTGHFSDPVTVVTAAPGMPIHAS